MSLLDIAKNAEVNNFINVSSDKWRLKTHLMAPVGWINDPNGLCFFKGYYHVFFQYSPTTPLGGDKYWGHYISPDMINWTYVGIPFSPDEDFDKNGVYSGCAYVEDDVMHVFYTGNVKEEGDHDFITSGRQGNVIYVSSTDGIHFSPKKCLLTNKDYPKHYSCHIRDPKVWKEEDIYYMVLGGRTLEDEGSVLVYKSVNLLEWNFAREIQLDCSFGYMWECPDLFVVDDVPVLSVSPQGVEAEAYRFQNVDQSGYFIMQGSNIYDFAPLGFKEWDLGFDFYAPQTFVDNHGRRIMYGWIGLPAMDYINPTVNKGWQHCLSMPRHIEVYNGKLIQNPVKEFQALRGKQITNEDLENSVELIPYEAFISDIDEETNVDIEISSGLDLKYNAKNRTFAMEFKNHIGYGRDIRITKIDSLKNVRVFADTSCVEVYLNQGEYVFTSRYYPAQSSIHVSGQGSTINIWELRGMEVNYEEININR